MQRVAMGLLLAGSILGVMAEASADCPDGSRTVGAGEQQAYVAVATAIKAVAASPGWTTLARC